MAYEAVMFDVKSFWSEDQWEVNVKKDFIFQKRVCNRWSEYSQPHAVMHGDVLGTVQKYINCIFLYFFSQAFLTRLLIAK